MPVYEYACKACGQHLEVSQSFTDDPLTVCPSCGGQLRKVFNSIGISFKGTGFYRTDSRMAARPKDKDSKDTKETKETKEKATADSSSGSGGSGGSGDKAKSGSGSSGDTSSSSVKPDAKSA